MGNLTSDERLWILVARLGLLQRMGFDASHDLVESIRKAIAQLDPRPADEILATLRHDEGFRAYEESEQERYAQSATATQTGKDLLLRSLRAALNVDRESVNQLLAKATGSRDQAERPVRARIHDHARAARRQAAKVARRKNRKR